MSDLNKVARPYAKAVFKLALETDKLDKWEQRLANLAEVVQVSDMREFLMNPSLTKELKQEVILQIAKLEGDKEMQQFIAELGYQNRLLFLPAIYNLYLSYKNQKEGTISVQLTSAFALKDGQVQALREALEKRYKKHMELEIRQDSNLIGGVVIRVGDMIIDYSLKGRLKKLEEVLKM